MQNTINTHLKHPGPLPVILVLDLADRLAPMNINESPMWFVQLVAARINDTGRHVDDLTVREIREIIEDCRTATNKAAKKKAFWWRYR